MRGIPLRRRVRATRVIGAVTALLLSAGALAACATGSTDADGPAPSQTATPTPTPTPTPLTPAEQLLAANTSVAGACAVSFQLEGATIDPQLQVQDHLFDRLPIPRAAGRAFAGWYADPAAAAAASADPTTGAANPAVRVNGSHLVACPTHQLTLYGADAVQVAAVFGCQQADEVGHPDRAKGVVLIGRGYAAELGVGIQKVVVLALKPHIGQHVVRVAVGCGAPGIRALAGGRGLGGGH